MEKWSKNRGVGPLQGHIGYGGCAHGRITTNTDTEDDTANEDPCEDLITVEVTWGRNRDNGGNDEDEFFSIDELSTELISKETETKLTNDTIYYFQGFSEMGAHNQ
jgi:hypothetical protein